MKTPEYVSKSEVKKVCRQLGIRDWSALKKEDVSKQEASVILKEVNTEKMKIPVEEFRRGLEVELEHGTRYKDANVTNNHPILTGMIVLAHLKETMDYYERLDVAELEGDLLKALKAKNLAKIQSKYKQLVYAQGERNKAISQQI